MKTVVEFGVIGGNHVDNIVCHSIKAGAKLTSSLEFVFSTNVSKGRRQSWTPRSDMPRLSWRNATHFVAISLLDGVDRGPASTKLWRSK